MIPESSDEPEQSMIISSAMPNVINVYLFVQCEVYTPNYTNMIQHMVKQLQNRVLSAIKLSTSDNNITMIETTTYDTSRNDMEMFLVRLANDMGVDYKFTLFFDCITMAITRKIILFVVGEHGPVNHIAEKLALAASTAIHGTQCFIFNCDINNLSIHTLYDILLHSVTPASQVYMFF